MLVNSTLWWRPTLMAPLCSGVTNQLLFTDRPRSCWTAHTDLLAAASETGGAPGCSGAAEVQVHGPVTAAAAAAGVARAAAASEYAMRQKSVAAAPGLAAAGWFAGAAAGSDVRTAVACEAHQATGADVNAANLLAAHDAVAAAGFVAAVTVNAADASAAGDDVYLPDDAALEPAETVAAVAALGLQDSAAAVVIAAAAAAAEAVRREAWTCGDETVSATEQHLSRKSLLQARTGKCAFVVHAEDAAEQVA